MRSLARSACTTLVLLAAAAGPAFAHTITIDGSTADWRGALPPIADLGRVARDTLGGGEYVWADAVGDQRAGWTARSHDLRELRVTGDGFNLYVMAVLDGPTATSGDSVPQLQLAIDLDRLYGSGATALTDGAATAVSPAAAYELLVETRFGSGQAPRVLDAAGNEVAVPTAGVLSPAGVMEIAVPWAAFGSCCPITNPLRLSAALFLTDAADRALAPPDTIASRATDAVTQNAGPGAPGTTAAEVADGTLDYWFDVTFDARGEVIAPVVVNEVYFMGGSKAQWIEIVNASQDVVALSGLKLGDADTPGDGKAMGQLPGGLLVPGASFVVAADGATFLANYGFRAGAECQPSDPGTPDLLPFPAWASTTGFDMNSSGDDVLLLDGANTVLDLLAYKHGAWPGVIPSPGPMSLHSLERVRPDLDTDDCARDFADQPSPDPGVAPPLAGVPRARAGAGGLRWDGAIPNPAFGAVTLALHLGSRARLRVDVIDVTGRAVRHLVRGDEVGAGDLLLRWDGRDERGLEAAPGLYIVRAATPEGARTLRIERLR